MFCRSNNADTSQPEGQTVGELYNKLLQLQEDMTTLGENSQKLLDDREEKQHSMDVRSNTSNNDDFTVECTCFFFYRW